MNHLIDIILEDFSKRYNVSIHPTGEYLLYKLGYINDLPKQIELGCNHSCSRVINITDRCKIIFKPSSLTWVTNIVNLHLRYLLILLQTRWKTTYKVEKDYTLKFAVSGEVKAEETKAEEAKTAATGSSAPLKYGVIAIVACAIAAALFVVFKKKK